MLEDLNASIANGSITTDMLSPAVLSQLNPPLDDLRIYDRVLSDAEVKALHDLGQ